MSLGVRSDAETAVRAGFRNSLLASRPEAEAEAIDAYLRSLEPVASPYLQNGRLSPAAERERQVFEAAGCRNCHPAPLYTDTRSYDVGTSPDPQETLEIDTPALIEVWRTAPYLHDGRAATVEDVFKRCNPENRRGHTTELSRDDLAALAEFVLSQ